MKYKALLMKDGFILESKNARFTKILINLGYELQEEEAEDGEKFKAEPETIEVPEFEKVTVDQIKTILEENEIEFGTKETKTELYAKLMQLEGREKTND